MILKYNLLALCLITSLIFTAYSYAAYVELEKTYTTAGYNPRHLAYLDKIVALIPRNASVLTQNEIFPHVSNRINAYAYPPSPDFEPDYVLFDVKLKFYKLPPPDPPFAEFIPRFIREHPNYGVYASADGIILLRKNWNASPIFYVPYREILNYKKLKLAKGRIIYDETSYSRKVFIHKKDLDSPGVFWYGPYQIFPLGTFKVTYRLKVSEIVDDLVIIVDVSTGLGTNILNRTVINGTNFNNANEWQNFTLIIKLDVPTELEIRGIYVSSVTDVYLDCIYVEQIGI